MRHASRRASQSLGQAADRVRRVALLLNNAVVVTDPSPGGITPHFATQCEWNAPVSRMSSNFLRRIVGVSLTTSTVSRHSFSVQAAGAGSHKPKSWRRRRGNDRRVPSMSTLSAQSVSPHHDGVLHQTSLRSRWTMMTRANSLNVREAGRPINVSVTRARGPAPTRAFPHGHRAYDCRVRPRRQNSA